jgi:Zn-dependent peptidase ImmA (M78 family)
VSESAATSASDLRRRLKRFGLSDSAISAAWPRWWSDAADASVSARADLTFSVARRLGLDPVSLLGHEDEPRFLWREEARFKHLSNEGELELAGITSFGRSVASALIAAAPAAEGSAAGMSGQQLREQILASGRPYVDLLDLLNLCWAVGVPVVHLRVFPWPEKRMAAMTVAVQGSAAILLAKDAVHPPAVAFYLAHELGHLGLGHLGTDRIIVDLGDPEGPVARGDDDEEVAADEFALELLTGNPEPTVVTTGERPTATRLAAAALGASAELRVEPGTLAQIFGYSTGDWRVATGALKVIYDQEKPVWQEVNAVARRELQFDLLTDDAAEYVSAVIGDASSVE